MRTYRSAAVTAAFALLQLPAIGSAKAPEEFAFVLPAEPLAQSLKEVAIRAGRSVIAPAELVAHREAPPLAGSFTAEEAVRRLLAGSGLGYRVVDGSLVIQPDPGTGESVARALAAPQEIVVTGTHVRGAPPTSPVISLTRTEIDQSGATSVEDLMRRFPQNVSAGVDQENFGTGGTGSDVTQYGAGINLRGLGQRATLVLINGHRVAPSDTGAFVDVSLIPISAIERVEVLTDGASAIYGSDAVGGVVNFILRKDFSGIEPVLQVGAATEGGGQQLLAGITAGQTWNGGSGLLSYEYRDDGPVRARDREFTVNLEPGWFLLPDERRNSLYGSLHQDLTPDLELDLSGLFAVRHTTRTFFDATRIAITGDAHARSAGGTAAIQFRPAGSWAAEVSASYYGVRTREEETQAGSLFNRSNTLNGFGELAVKADGGLFELPGGTAKLAVGAGLRRDHFESLFSSSVNVPAIVDASRTVSSAYGELNLPVFSATNRTAGLERLMFTAAARFEHYERVGSTFNPKLGILWSPLPGVALRSSYGTSFRAPLLSESAGVYNVFLFPAAILYQDPSLAGDGVGAAVIGSNPNVKPERSKSLSAGIEVAPPAVPGLRFSGNYYSITFSNRIALPSPEVDLIGNPAFAPVVTLNPLTASVAGLFSGANQVLDFSGPGFTDGSATPADVIAVVDDRVSNTAETRTSGLDLLLDYGFRIGGDQLHTQLNVNRVFRFDDKLTSASPWIRRLDTPFNPVRWRARAGMSWRRGPVSAVSFFNYTASYRDNRTPQVRPVHSFTTVDAGLAIDGSATGLSSLRRARLAVNIDNLFDAKPPRLAPSPGSGSGIGYDPVNASGLGRTVSLQLRASW